MLRPLIMLTVFVAGCSSSLPRPLRSPHTPDEFVEVPYPAPAVRADVVPPRPHPESVWIDGEWQWQELRWGWRRGNWVVAPEGSTLAPWETHRNGTQLLHAPSVLHLARGGSLAPSELVERRRTKLPADVPRPSPASASFDQRAVWPEAKSP